MNLWQERTSKPAESLTASTTDVVFKIVCDRLPVDHALPLSQAVNRVAPWLCKSPNAGTHPIHVAGSQNGWERPDMSSDAHLILSRRTRLIIRVDQLRATELIESLCDQTLHVDGHKLRILSGSTRTIKPAATLFSRYTFFDHIRTPADQEEPFMEAVIEQCTQLGYQPTKLMCGKSYQIKTSQGQICARGVLLADVPHTYSQRLQENGMGDLRSMGCGLLIPHKDTGAIQALNDE